MFYVYPKGKAKDYVASINYVDRILKIFAPPLR